MKEALANQITLRPYQTQCIETVDNLPEGSRTIVCLATGLGKTVTAANFKADGRILWLSHRDELVRQPEKYFAMLGKSYGIEKAGEESNGEDVVSASIQTLSREKRLEKFKEDDFELIICDEAQHTAAKTYRKIIDYFRPKKLIGLTATPKRGDNVRLDDIFDDICFTRDLKWGIENGYLSRIRCIRVSAKFDVKKIKTSMGDLTVSSMQTEMLASDDDVVVAKAYMEYCLPENKKTLIYCPTIKVCQRVHKTMTDMLSDDEKEKVKILSDKTSPKDREDMLIKYRDTMEINCIINCMILTEGTDLPQTSVIINNRPTANSSLYQQIIGRGTRLAEGKEYCLIVDVMGKNSIERNLCSAPTLFGIDPDVLPDKIQERIYGEDLLEITQDLKENRANRVKAIALHKEMIDIFTGRCISIIEDNKDKGLSEVASAYESSIKSQNKKYDFGDLIVKTGPEDDKYFCIPVTYNGNIYISKPDMLEKSFVTIDIPREETMDGKRWYGISTPIPTKAALDAVNTIIRYGILLKYKHRWSRQARENMKRVRATDRQLSYIQSLYSDSNVDTLNKLEASSLIDLKDEIESLERKSRALSYQQKIAQKEEDANKKKRNYKQIIKAKNEKEEMIRESERNRAHEDYKLIMRACIANKISQDGIYKKMLDDKKEKSIMIRVTSAYTHMYAHRPSKKQLDYLQSLSDTLTENGFVFDLPPVKIKGNMYCINFMIKLLKEFEMLPPTQDGYEYFVGMADFVNKVNAIPQNISNDMEVTCIYTIRHSQPLFE